MSGIPLVEDIFNPGKAIAKEQGRQRTQAIGLADPSRLNELLFGSPAVEATPGTPFSGLGGIFGGGGFGAARGFARPGSAGKPATPGLVSQFRTGMMPQLNALLDQLTTSGQQLQSTVAGRSARRGLTGTGIGEALAGAAAGVPVQAGAEARRGFDLNAFQQALAAAVQLMGAQAGVPLTPGAPSTSSQIGQAAMSFFLPWLANRQGQGGGGTQSVAGLQPGAFPLGGGSFGI